MQIVEFNRIICAGDYVGIYVGDGDGSVPYDR